MKGGSVLVLSVSQLIAFKYIDSNNRVKFGFGQFWIWQVSVPVKSKSKCDLRCRFEFDKQEKISVISHSDMKSGTDYLS